MDEHLHVWKDPDSRDDGFGVDHPAGDIDTNLWPALALRSAVLRGIVGGSGGPGDPDDGDTFTSMIPTMPFPWPWP